MFKLQRHDFTCDDVIYLRSRNRKIFVANLAAVALMTAALNVWGRRLEKKEIADLQNETPEK